MFTGIITDLGKVKSVAAAASTCFEITTAYDLATVAIGASIACAGVCLTVVEKSGHSFTVDVSNETLAHTTLGAWQVGRPINLERPLRAGDELGGHIVSGHVDAVSYVIDRKPDGASVRFTFALPDGLAGFIAPKGSITVDGVSLTVNEVEEGYFGVNLIPHTLEVTSLGDLQAGSAVNIEIDVVARYLARLVRPELMRSA
ncbi:MAG: riboflavin synthase subunit alpha [Rhodospirillales bacterium]|nr:riboflavin synthase subunit alpha [Rhodospirillales bacterium]